MLAQQHRSMASCERRARSTTTSPCAIIGAHRNRKLLSLSHYEWVQWSGQKVVDLRGAWSKPSLAIERTGWPWIGLSPPAYLKRTKDLEQCDLVQCDLGICRSVSEQHHPTDNEIHGGRPDDNTWWPCSGHWRLCTAFPSPLPDLRGVLRLGELSIHGYSNLRIWRLH